MNRKISHSKTRENKIKTIPKYTIGHPPIWKDLNFLKNEEYKKQIWKAHSRPVHSTKQYTRVIELHHIPPVTHQNAHWHPLQCVTGGSRCPIVYLGDHISMSVIPLSSIRRSGEKTSYGEYTLRQQDSPQQPRDTDHMLYTTMKE